MPRLANLAALLAALGPALATAALADGVYTETIGAQEVGSTTIDGTMVYSMNYCSVVHSTQCYTSLSTGGPAPTSIPGYSSASSPPAPTYGQPGGGGSSSRSSSVHVPTSVSSGSSVENPSTTPVVSSESVTGEPTSTTATTSKDGGSSTTKIPDVPTGAAVMGASVMGNVLVAALAAFVV
ncbi:hypothetical protein CRV24_003002 [Beauveria bassiana]|uniref:Uncharacterized protein n=1 Tax=Beauveria bassiana (strain ARSEF 2860) TaxID=655819 RepID=J4WIA1_BEAB2|nr:uncharacterized protein BBA_01540 [Beauveria bassiana ARSEF 2860]EJP69575.1 hypothetical protein BBA_01540 [Beauveria bassiana ARSEF 2860]KAF1737384.1 hypothetical protein CRV24_003002 [Beauveria bassiana]KAH8718395.1 hypothetical protein HC256_003039 [Beauveria bassiana]